MTLNFRDHKYVLLWELQFFQEIPPTPHLVIWLDREVCLIPWLSLRKAGYSKPAILSTCHLHSVMSDSATPGTAAHQASLSFTFSWSLLKFMSVELVIPSNHLILCHPLLLLPSIFPSIRVFSNESTLRIRWPKYWSFSFSISPSNEYSGLISISMD